MDKFRPHHLDGFNRWEFPLGSGNESFGVCVSASIVSDGEPGSTWKQTNKHHGESKDRHLWKVYTTISWHDFGLTGIRVVFTWFDYGIAVYWMSHRKDSGNRKMGPFQHRYPVWRLCQYLSQHRFCAKAWFAMGPCQIGLCFFPHKIVWGPCF